MDNKPRKKKERVKTEEKKEPRSVRTFKERGRNSMAKREVHDPT